MPGKRGKEGGVCREGEGVRGEGRGGRRGMEGEGGGWREGERRRGERGKGGEGGEREGGGGGGKGLPSVMLQLHNSKRLFQIETL